MPGLFEDMRALLPFAGNRRLGLDMAAFSLSADNLAHLGLIAVELVTNALKHGRGTIEVAVTRRTTPLRSSFPMKARAFPILQSGGAGWPWPEDRFGHGRPRSWRAITVDRSVPFSRLVVTMALTSS